MAAETSTVTIETPKTPRKRKRSITPGNWKRAQQKVDLYSAPGEPIYPVCGHRRTLHCALLTPTDVNNFHRAFYLMPSKQEQDVFLLRFCKTNPPKRLRVADNNRKQSRETIVDYFVLNQAGNKVPVCRKSFLGILRISKQRVLSVFTKFKKEGALIPLETRGGDRKTTTFQDKQDSVKSFIKRLKTTESHYGRSKSVRRYLPSELSISKLWKLYNDAVLPELQVKESYFRNIFVTCFNISFSAPAVDECSFCLEISERIKMAKDTEKDALCAEKAKHTKLAKSFYVHLQKKPDDCLLLSFDCQKNLPLPKVTDQQAYYSRQLYCYNLSVVRGISTSSLSPENVSIYTWSENQSKKSSNEVASIIINELQAQDLKDYTNVRLVCDGCPGQNKNVNVLTACAKWLLTQAPKKLVSVELVYPVTGHSFLPSDRVFGMIEKQLKKMPTIVDISEYHNIFRQFGTVKFLGVDWSVYDWRAEAQTNVKTAAQLHFKIQQSKKIVLRRTKFNTILVKGELTYSSNSAPEKIILKPKVGTFILPPVLVPIGVSVNPKKLNDVRSLLRKHFGENWAELESLQWYVTVLNDNDRFAINNPVVEQNADCVDENNNDNDVENGTASDNDVENGTAIDNDVENDTASDDDYDYQCECFEFYVDVDVDEDDGSSAVQ